MISILLINQIFEGKKQLQDCEHVILLLIGDNASEKDKLGRIDEGRSTG